MESYHIESIAVITELTHFARGKKMPTLLFDKPDHIALHASNIRDFDRRVKEIERQSEELIFREAHDRFIITAKLAGPLALADIGRIHWVEIIEPIEEEAKVGLIGGDHVEFLYPDFSGVRELLKNRNIDYRIDEDPQPRIKVPYGKNGDEIRFTSQPIGEILAQDIELGEATAVKRAA